MTDKDEIEKPVRSGWVLFGFCTTGLYLGALGLLLAYSGPDSIFPIKKDALELNTLGDFVAGICAPLAFLWLFVATMVQSQELALQRQELRLTRREFEQNREVAKEQAAEAKSQAIFIGTQTEMLVWAENDKHLSVLLEGIRSLVNDGTRQPLVFRTGGLGQSTQVGGPFERADRFNDVVEAVHQSAERVREVLGAAPNIMPGAFEGVGVLQTVASYLIEVNSILPKTSPKQKAELAQMGFARLEVATAYLLDVFTPG